jgi:two-component system, OmpR family, sensor histidine kinase BaeS
MSRSFAVRLAVAFAAVGLAAAAMTALLVNLAFGAQFADYLEQRHDARRSHLVASLGDAYERTAGWDRQELSRIASVALMDGGSLRIESPGGALLWESLDNPQAEWHRQMMGTGPLGVEQQAPIVVDGEVIGMAVLQLPEPGLLPHDVAFRTSVNRMLIAGAVVAGLLALVLGGALARRATAPARALTEAARTLATGDLTARVPAERRDEFGSMARAFNRMAQVVEAEDRIRRAFAADVAHELRTPLMILRGEIEALQDGVSQPTAVALASLREETLRLGRLVDDLDTLARADAAGFSLERRATDLGQVVADAAAEYGSAFAERSMEVELIAAGELVASVDPVRITQVIANLLSNAAKFTPEGGRVRITTEQIGESAEIAVWNSGPPIPADELPHVFNRFFRGRHAAGTGSGIGLTVVSDLARAHGGDVEVVSSASAGTTFRVRLPLRVPAAAPVGAG